MKKTLISMAFMLACIAATAQENLLSNPGFEDGIPTVINGQKETRGSWLAFFQKVRGGMKAEEAKGYEGSCLKLDVYKADKPVWDNYIYQNLDLTPGEYQISFWAKADKPTESRNALRFSIKPKTAAYLMNLRSPFAPKKKIGTEWQQVVQSIKIGETQDGLEGARFTIHLEEAGNVFYIDNIELIKIK